MTVPPDFTRPQDKWCTAKIAAGVIATKAAGRRAVVQAGGCVGLWPLALAKYFQRVYTFEPEPTNYACLQRNIAAVGHITAQQAALGDRADCVGLTRPKVGAGLWRVDGAGDIPMVVLDDVVDDAIDAIVLDVEGSEVPALRGCERLIATHRPLLWFEFLTQTAAIEDFIATHGYTAPTRALGGDRYSVHTSRVAHA